MSLQTWYLRIDAMQEPFDLGLDQVGRSQFYFNIMVLKRPSATFVKELVSVLQDAGLGTFGSSIFSSSSAVIPNGDGPYTQIIQTGGTAPLRTQNEPGAISYSRATAQIIILAKDADIAQTFAHAVFAALLAVQNRDVTVAAV